ncbi:MULTISPECIES: choice-of-anchor J family PEP-CTERM protein [unclassified Duganella]|uniref:choice-of-anchor J family PEP-CTERM protein n=1 Tax=unclassified Duganella TaxID=2636909 RepID=UPI000E3480FA|nr:MULTISPECIES: choice-of-anchor J domain-containing protein [unclassified Duganella]RFP19125.1 PEP-CTERM sorting domain-containing protein [Duganella sp. BJB475]RFP35787.1 PEP-CTERM sorting domain-containing protein [Duganella sp. BJB476]
MNFNKYLIGLAAAAATSSAFASPLLSEGFNDIGTLASSGWVMTNNSNPVGATSWYQGQDFAFHAAQGPSDSYISANNGNTNFSGSISNWLITPEVAMANGEKLNFSLRLLAEVGAIDTVEVYYSTAGASSNVGSTATSTGDFHLLQTYSASTDNGWSNNSLTLSGLSGSTTGRYAFRYVVDNTAINGDTIGIDSVNISAVPEPTTALMLLLGLGVVAVSRKKQLRLLALAGLSASTLVAQAAEPQTGANGLMSFPNSRVVVAPELSATAAPAGAGLVAYKDAATGQLVGPSAEQAAELAAAAVPTASASAQVSRRVALGGRIAPLSTAQGGVGRKLDDSTASFAVIHKDADGNLVESCVPGEDVAHHLAHGPSLPAVKGEQQ